MNSVPDTESSVTERSLSPNYADSPFLPSVNEASLTEISRTAKKKGQQQEKYLVDENLGEVERAVHLLKNGSSIQKLSVLENFSTLFIRNQEKASTQILKFFLDNLWKENEETQSTYGDYISTMFQYLSPKQMHDLLPLLQTMSSSKKESVAYKWEKALIRSVQYLPIEIVEKDIIDLAESKGSLSAQEKNRIFCCKLFGAISKRCTSSTISSLFLKQAISLCQDTSFEVRKNMAKQLVHIANGLGLEETKRVLFAELIQLCEDETKEVKKTATWTLISLLSFFDKPYRSKEILPKFLQWIKEPVSGDRYTVLNAHFGEFLFILAPDCTDDEITMFCNFFSEAARNKSLDIRNYCAYNFPGVLKSIGPQRYQTQLQSTFQLLCEDKETSVREKLASGFHEVSSILVSDKKSVGSLKKIFLKLLRDKDINVRDKIVSHMSEIFHNFKMSSPSSQVDELFSSIIASLVKYHACIKTDWRRLDSFYAHFDTFGNYFTAEQIGTTIIPMLRVEIVSSCAIPLKEKATNAIVVMVRYLKNVTRQVEIFNELWKELGENKSYWHRMTYLELFHCIWKHFSRRFVKEHAFSDVMKLSSDPVANVRLKFCKLLPELKQVLQLPNDVQLLATLKETVSYLSLDKDRDVVSAAQKAQQALLAIDNEINRGHRQNLQTLEDRTDNEREREETLWMEIELENEKAKKREAMQLNVDPVKPPSADSKTTPNGTSNLIAKPVPKPVPKGQVGNAKTVPKVVSPPPPTGSKSPTKQPPKKTAPTSATALRATPTLTTTKSPSGGSKNKLK